MHQEKFETTFETRVHKQTVHYVEKMEYICTVKL